jgi:predicted acetyltransferase
VSEQPTTFLSIPSEDQYDAWADCVRDFGNARRDGSGDWQVPGLGPDRASFARLLEVIRLESDPASVLAEGRVHSDYYWITDGVDLVGFLALRHSLATEFLRTQGGHIGYSVRPSRRRRGHASRALGLALGRARELGLERVLVTCDEDNVASARTIESQGGRFEGVHTGKRRYWIATSSDERTS